MLTEEESTLTPIASLSSLPIEIKTIIVNLAKLQDENYKKRINSKNKDESELTKGVLKENEWRGKSLNALFLVNKEFSDLAAVHIFKLLCSKQVAPSFQFEILPYRGSLIRSVLFDKESFLSETLLHLQALVNLQTVKFFDGTLNLLFGDLVNPGISGNQQQNFQYSALVAAGRRLHNLDIGSGHVSHVTGILTAFTVLKKLTLHLLSKVEDEYNDAKMLQLGTKLSQYSFESLELGIGLGGIPECWTKLDWKSYNSLTQLDCTFHYGSNGLNISFFSFLNNFSSLEYLKFYFNNFSSSLEDHNNHNPQQFTHLTRLDITSAIYHLPQALPLFTTSPIRTFRFEIDNLTFSSDDESTLEATLIKFVNQHQQTLKVIEICDRIIRINLPLIQLCSSQSITLLYSKWPDQQIYHSEYPLPDTSQFNYRRPILEKALNFGKNKLVELENDNDIEGLKEMFDNCKWLRAGLAEKED